MHKDQRVPKVVVFGSPGVGRSSLIQQFVQGSVIDDFDPTIEDRYRRRCCLERFQGFVEVLDTSDECCSALRDLYLQTADGFICVYSITSAVSFHELPAIFRSIERVKGGEPCPIIIVGNKCDLEDEREVETVAAQRIAKEKNCPFFETSATARINVEDAFFQIIQDILDAEGRPTRAQNKHACTIS